MGQLKVQQESTNLSSTETLPAFDNSDNETSIDQLTNQLNAQSLLINQLQTQIQSQLSAAQATSAEVLPENNQWRQKRLAIDVLHKTMLLLDAQRLSLAVQALDDFLSFTEIDAVSKRPLVQLSRQLKEVDVPDTKALKQQLTTLKAAVDELQLNTAAEPIEEGSWYSQLITVKKIADDEAINSTAKLLEFKLELKQALLQAGLFLTLNDQLGWSDSLIDAAHLMKAQMPGQHDMLEQLQQLSEQAVAIQLPGNINIQFMIDELKGLR